MQFVSRVNEAMGLQLPSSLVFDYPSLPAMARHIHSKLPLAQTAPICPESLVVPLNPDINANATNEAKSIPVSYNS